MRPTFEVRLYEGLPKFEVIYGTTRNGFSATIGVQKADGSRIDPRDYDVAHYVHQLRTTVAARLATAFSPEHFAAVFGDPDQLSLFATPITEVRSILTVHPVEL